MPQPAPSISLAAIHDAWRAGVETDAFPGGHGGEAPPRAVRERHLWLPRGQWGDGLHGLATTVTFPLPANAPPTAGRASAAPPLPPLFDTDLGVVWLHGWGGARSGPHRMLARLARGTALRGGVALRMDLPGRGLSDGLPDQANLDDMIDAAIWARDWLRAAGCRAVSFGGICSGGNVAIGAAAMAAARGPAEAAPARLALLSTLPFQARTARMGRRKRWHLLRQYLRRAWRWSTWVRLLRGEINRKGVAQALKASGAEDAAGRRLRESRHDLPALWAVARVPARFVYGSGDPEAAPSWAHYSAFCRSSGIEADAVWVPDANHNFYAAPWSRQAEQAALDGLFENIH